MRIPNNPTIIQKIKLICECVTLTYIGIIMISHIVRLTTLE
jgi:hypothetical protein